MGNVKTYPRTPDVNLSSHFALHEFACKDNGVSKTVLVDDELVQRLETLRSRLGGKAININSGYRSPNHDKAVGGSGRGFHTKGMAADIWVQGLTCVQLGMLAKEVGFRGIGMYHRKPSEQVSMLTHARLRVSGFAVLVQSITTSRTSCLWYLLLLRVIPIRLQSSCFSLALVLLKMGSTVLQQLLLLRSSRPSMV